MLTFFVPRMSSVAVGEEMTGPAPQMTLPAFSGDRKNETCTSPSPLVPFTVGATSGTWITGKSEYEVVAALLCPVRTPSTIEWNWVDSQLLSQMDCSLHYNLCSL